MKTTQPSSSEGSIDAICHLTNIRENCYTVLIDHDVTDWSGFETAVYCSLNISYLIPILLESMLKVIRLDVQIFCLRIENRSMNNLCNNNWRLRYTEKPSRPFDKLVTSKFRTRKQLLLSTSIVVNITSIVLYWKRFQV